MISARTRAYLELLAVAIIWGVAGPVIKLTLGKIAPDLFILYRFLISAIISVTFFSFKRFEIPKDRKVIIEILIYCLLNSSVSLGLLFYGTAKTSLLEMSLIQLFGPLMMVAAGYFYLNEHVTSREKVGAFVAFVGSSIIGLGPILQKNHSSGEFVGNLMVFLSLVTGVIAGILGKKLMRDGFAPNLLANLTFVIGFVTILPFVVLKSGFNYALSPLHLANPGVWISIAYMAVMSGNVAYSLGNSGQKTVELSEAALFSYLYPTISAILAILALGEKMSGFIIMGTIVTFIGVFVAEWKLRS